MLLLLEAEPQPQEPVVAARLEPVDLLLLVPLVDIVHRHLLLLQQLHQQSQQSQQGQPGQTQRQQHPLVCDVPQEMQHRRLFDRRLPWEPLVLAVQVTAALLQRQTRRFGEIPLEEEEQQQQQQHQEELYIMQISRAVPLLL